MAALKAALIAAMPFASLASEWLLPTVTVPLTAAVEAGALAAGGVEPPGPRPGRSMARSSRRSCRQPGSSEWQAAPATTAIPLRTSRRLTLRRPVVDGASGRDVS